MPIEALEARFLASLGATRDQRLGLAVSGGGDSMAMLHLCARAGLPCHVATVDHGLRAEARTEAEEVGRVCARLGLPHEVLAWQGWDGAGNTQDRARRARRTLLATWAQRHNLDAVLLAHTSDDLAESMLMRLARGAGVDGLAAMRSHWAEGGMRFIRPLLDIGRAELRSYLGALGADWVEDPSNDAPKYARVQARRALTVLAPLGMRAATLAGVAQHLRAASEALDFAADTLAREVITLRSGIITLSPAIFAAPPELRRRLVQRALLWLAPADYAPRGSALLQFLARIEAGKAAQLAGVHALRLSCGHILLFPEAARSQTAALWRVPDAPEGSHLAALGGAGLSQWAGWRAAGFPRMALLSQPALWVGETLVATPLNPDLAQNYAFLRVPLPDSLFNSRLSH